ncbi:MAG: FKBP-type peptidyl-prolyl cis-trans isomerase [Muribaculaceae bacterium]|nr:FKBP-type peptidyl-prolyl cis-trans isomerase [Muribaculaceae bacterium]
MRRLLYTLLLAVTGFATAWGSPAAADDAATPAAADTVSAALATVWGSHITPVLDAKYPGNAKAAAEFIRGISDAFNVSAEQEPYYQGILQGFTVAERLEQMKQLGFPIDRESFLRALSNALEGGDTGFTPTTADRYLSDYMSRQYEAKLAADTLSVESQRRFIEQNATREGVITTPSGLLFEVITEGEGEGPTLDDAVSVTYTGKLYNGEIFDDSEGSDVTFPVSGLVPGFTQGLLMMKPGGTYRIIIPADLGYGPRGTAGVIPGNAALDFTITLHRVIKH